MRCDMELEMQHGLQQKQNLSKKMLQSVHVLEMSMEETEDFLKEIIEIIRWLIWMMII